MANELALPSRVAVDALTTAKNVESRLDAHERGCGERYTEQRDEAREFRGEVRQALQMVQSHLTSATDKFDRGLGRVHERIDEEVRNMRERAEKEEKSSRALYLSVAISVIGILLAVSAWLLIDKLGRIPA